MDSQRRLCYMLLFCTFLSSSSQDFYEEQPLLIEVLIEASTPFSIALDRLQNHINYTFKNVGLLRRAMTHSSFSEENNKALGVLGVSIIETSVALQSLSKNVDIPPKDLNAVISDVSKVDGSCNTDGTHLGLQKIVRVSHKTNITAPSVVCGAFRAIFGAIAIDAVSSDESGQIYLKVHGGIGKVVTM